MFLILGVSPKTKILDNTPRICPTCGLAQARLKRVDSYFNLFFIPFIRVKKGEPFIICDRCERMASETAPDDHPPSPGPDARCSTCGKLLDKDFRYCPACGRPVQQVDFIEE